MTREEAAMKLATHYMSCGMLMPLGWLDKNGEGSELFEAFKMAQDALRERNDGCEWCYILEHPEKSTELGQLLPFTCAEHTFVGDGAPYQQRMKFCPMCGRRLEDA